MKALHARIPLEYDLHDPLMEAHITLHPDSAMRATGGLTALRSASAGGPARKACAAKAMRFLGPSDHRRSRDASVDWSSGITGAQCAHPEAETLSKKVKSLASGRCLTASLNSAITVDSMKTSRSARAKAAPDTGALTATISIQQ